jgi:nucleoside 2-deoxyribosyltransferase
MKLYLAHNFAARDWLLASVIPALQAAGHKVIARWITDDSHVDPKNKRHSAEDDVADIERVDALILFVDQYGERPGRGKLFELGYAYGIGVKVFLIGIDESCVFYALPEFERYATIGQFIEDQRCVKATKCPQARAKETRLGHGTI